jgi:hypothetical protein
MGGENVVLGAAAVGARGAPRGSRCLAHLSVADRLAIRRAYELTAEPVRSIERRFGLTQYQLAKLRISERWTTRPQAAKPGPLSGRKPLGSEALEFRLNRLVVLGLTMLERRLSTKGLLEEDARTLRELCRAAEIMKRAARTEKAAKAREKKNDAHDFRNDPAWLRAEIDRKLDRLGQQRAPAADPRERDGGGA